MNPRLERFPSRFLIYLTYEHHLLRHLTRSFGVTEFTFTVWVTSAQSDPREATLQETKTRHTRHAPVSIAPVPLFSIQTGKNAFAHATHPSHDVEASRYETELTRLHAGFHATKPNDHRIQRKHSATPVNPRTVADLRPTWS